MKKSTSIKKHNSRGRPRSFSREEALDRAVEIFWAKGFEPTSVEDLTTHIGINTPSLYGAFGNKHDLFMEAMDRYAQQFVSLPTKAFSREPDIRQAIKALFDTTIQIATTTKHPKGCFLVSVGSEMAERDPEVRERLSRGLAGRVKLVAERIAAEQKDGRLPKQPDAESFAQMIISVTHSLALRARIGASRKELSKIAANHLDLMVPISDRVTMT